MRSLPAQRVFRPTWSRLLIITLAVMLFPQAPLAAMTEHVLDNGLRVVLRPEASNPVVCSAVLVRAGVAWEPEGMSGASHFLEHLLFNGTARRTQEQLYADVDALGAYNNATTRADHTLFMLLAPREHLQDALDIQADMLLHSTLPPDKFDKEKGIVLAEMGRSANNPGSLADDFFTRHLYAGTPYARPVLGTAASIQALQRDQVLDYYRDRYVPERMVLLLTGDFDAAEALEAVRRHFGARRDASATVAPDRTLPSAPEPFSRAGSIRHQHLEAGRTYLRAAFPAPAPNSVEAAAFEALLALLSAPGSALDETLKGGAQPAVFDYSLSHETTGGAGVLRFAASISGRQTAGEVMRALVDTVRHAVLERGLEPADLRSLAEERLTEAATLDEQLHYYALFRAPRLLAGSLDQVFRSSRQDVAQTLSLFPSLVQDSMDLSRALMTVSGPQESEGDETSFTDAAPSSRPRELAEPALPGSSPQVQVLTNGLTVSVHTRPEAEVFAIHLLARNRSALEPEGRDGLADAVHRLLLRGTLARDAGALSAELARIGASVKFHDDARFPFDDYRTTPAYSFAVLETRRDHAAAALRLFAEILQTPRFAAEEVARTEGIMQDLAARSRESSSALAADAFRGMVAPGHPLSRSVSGSRRSLAGLTRQEVMAMHARLFAPENLILSIRGGGDPGAVMSQVEASYGGRGTAGGFTAKEPAHGDGEEPVAVVPTVATPAPAAGSEAARFMVELGKAQSSLRMGAVLTVPPAMQAPLAAAVLVLSDRLQMSVREEQGLAYSVGAHLQSLGSGSALVTVALGTAPEHLAAAEDAVLQAARLLAEEPPPADEVQRVIAARRGRILMRRLPSQNQAMYDGLDLFRGEPSEGSLQALAALSRVTPAQIRQAARHLQPSRWAVAVAR